MNQSPFFMEVHANHTRNEVGRAVAHIDAMKQLRAYKSPAQLANVPLADRSAPTITFEGLARGLRLLVRGWTLALRGRAVA